MLVERNALVSTGWLSLRTPRLTLTPPTVVDAAQILAIVGDSRAVEHNPADRIDNLDEAEDLVKRWRVHWAQHGYGYWCIRADAGSDIIGYSGVKTVMFRGARALNLIYRLAPSAWGRGLATEAASAVVQWVTASLPGARIIARVRPANLASQRVAIKAGLQRAPEFDEPGEDGLDLLFTSTPT